MTSDISYSMQSPHAGLINPCYRWEKRLSEWGTASKMSLGWNPPAVALILWHLRFEARAFDVAGSAAGKERDGGISDHSKSKLECQAGQFYFAVQPLRGLLSHLTDLAPSQSADWRFPAAVKFKAGRHL